MSSDASATKTTTSDETPQLSEKMQKLLIAGVLSAKGGLPDVDYDKLTKLGGFNTKKTAQVCLLSASPHSQMLTSKQNQWGELKKLLKGMNPEAYEAAAAAKRESQLTPHHTDHTNTTSSRRPKGHYHTQEARQEGVRRRGCC